MALPKEKDIELPLLLEIYNMGGEVGLQDHPKLYKQVASHFPAITPQDLKETLPSSGANKFENRVEWARFNLIKKGESDASSPTSPKGIKRIINKGIERLRQEGFLEKGGQVKPVVVLSPPIDEVDKLVQEIKGMTEKLAELAKKVKEETPRLTHDDLVQKIKEMGEMLSKIAEVESGPVFRHDCVWKDKPYANPKLVVEVCDKGNLDKDIASLIFAVKNWDAKGILVLFEESDFHAAQRKLAQESQIYLLRSDDVLKLHSLLQAGNAQAVRSIFAI